MTEHRNSERDRDQSGDVIEGARRDASARPYGILIVDDEEAILESLELTLGSDYRVYKAPSGDKGLEILNAEEIALIIVDQVMPSMTGVEFFARAIEINPRAFTAAGFGDSLGWAGIKIVLAVQIGDDRAQAVHPAPQKDADHHVAGGLHLILIGNHGIIRLEGAELFDDSTGKSPKNAEFWMRQMTESRANNSAVHLS